MNRGVVLAIGGAVIAAANLAGCSDSGKAKLLVDGQEQKLVDIDVSCHLNGNDPNAEFLIDVAEGVHAHLSHDEIEVDSVSFGKFDGLSFPWQKWGASNPRAVTVVKDGKSYKISGRVEGTDDSSRRAQEVHNVKNFELNVTCP